MANVTKLHKKERDRKPEQEIKSGGINKKIICFQTRQPQIERNKLRYLPNYFSAVDIN